MVGFREALLIAYISLLLSYMSYASDTSAAPTPVSKSINNSPSIEKPTTTPTSGDKDSPDQGGNTQAPSTTTEQSQGPAVNASNTTVVTPTSVKPSASTKSSSVKTDSGGTTKHPDATTQLNKPDNQSNETSNISGALTSKSTTPLVSTTSKNVSVTTKNTVSTTQKPDNTPPVSDTSTNTTRNQNSTSTTTQKPSVPLTDTPNKTSNGSQKPDNTTVPTQKPDNTTVTTKKPDNTTVPTQKPDNTTVSSLKPDNTTISTLKANTTVSVKPSSTAASTQKPDSTSVTSQPATTQKPIITSSKKPASFPPRDEFVYISEIMVDRNGGFQKVELQLSKQFDVAHYAMVMVDGKTEKDMSVVYLKDMVLQKNGLLVITFNSSQSSPSMKDNGTGVAIYDTRQMSLKGDWTVSKVGLVDALVIGKTYTGVSEHLTDILTPGVNPFILDPNKYGMSRTISRCSSEQLRNTDMFALINPSFGTVNKKKCQERLSASSDFAIKIKNINCSVLEDNSDPVTKFDLTQKKLIHYIVKNVNAKCHCGVTWMHIVDPVVHCCDGASLDMRFVAPNKDQLSELKDNYKKFLNETGHVNIANHLYQIDNSCNENCCNVRKHPEPQAVSDTAKNVKVTVAVIVSCLIVFMIVVIIVIMYMKRKKRAVYQFRMSRLDEEDDLVIDGPDHEDFVGGQEATFDVYPR